MSRRLLLPLLFALAIPGFLHAEGKPVDPQSLVGKTVDAAMATLGLKWEQVQLQDEPPGVFRKVYIDPKAAARLMTGSDGKAVYLVPLQTKRLFSEKMDWDRKVVGKMVVERVDIGPK